MILTYRIFVTLIYPLLCFFIYFRKILRKEHPERYKEKIAISFFNAVKRKVNSKLIWFHAASIGELKSIIPIIKELNSKNNNLEFLITSITLSSSNLAKVEFEKYNNVYHRFMPLDVGFLINKFLHVWKPDRIFLVDSEIWPNLILKANENKIPLALINARITLKTFKRWSIFPATAKKIFNLFNLCLTSNEETKNYLKKLNAKNIYFNGNIKLINKVDKIDIINLNEKILLNNRFWFAASTHKEEDLFCLKTHLRLKEKFKDLITIIAPRHIERVSDIKYSGEKLNIKMQILNKNEIILKDTEIVIINSFGILQNYFKYAKSVFIGKSIINKFKYNGGQNPIEAAKLGCKVYHGPYVYNFKEIYSILAKNNISKEITTFEELSTNLIQDLKDYKKKDSQISDIINDLGQKTLTDTMKNINKFLLNEI